VAVLVAVGVGLVGVYSLRSSADATEGMYRDELVGTVDVEAVRAELYALRLSAVNYALVDDPAARQQYMADRQEASSKLARAASHYLATHPTARSRELIDNALDGVNEYKAALPALDALAESGDLPGWAAERDAKAGPIATGIFADLDELATLRQDNAAASAVAASDAYAHTRWVLLGSLLLGAVVALAAGVLIARRITAGLRQVQHAAEGLALGDLTRTADVRSKDEVGATAAALDGAMTGLRSVMTSVVASADAVAASAEELSASAAQISGSAQETSAQSGVVSAAADSWRPWPPVRRRWVPRSGRSARTPTRRPRSPPRPWGRRRPRR
jgi:methyl-accepting chemotaxis protein